MSYQAIAVVAASAAVFALGALFLLRLWLLHQLRPERDFERFYGPYDMPQAVQYEVLHHEDLHFEFGLSGEDWEFDSKCKGRKRLFIAAHVFHLFHSARRRLRENSGFPFLWTHFAAYTLLCAAVAAKTLVLPSTRDVLALVGFDSITQERLVGIKAALKRTEGAPTD